MSDGHIVVSLERGGGGGGGGGGGNEVELESDKERKLTISWLSSLTGTSVSGLK